MARNPAQGQKAPLEICILAGGLSARLGRDKAKLRFGRSTMLSIIRSTASQFNVPVRVLRRDCVARCGPLGGVFTALRTSRAASVLFLACDMPLVTPALLRRVARAGRRGQRAVFTEQDTRVGFPFLLPASAIVSVQSQITRKEFSLWALAKTVDATLLHAPAGNQSLLNVNTQYEAVAAAELLRQRSGKRPGASAQRTKRVRGR